ncbi:YdcF family protein [Jatrophihabitans telluris]|uniref:YdcF family protein n=1 Tax=Jatrophihabitans telluris TaxID=2038343 RepID=A0ABY4QYM4_9ACTN|nr:YdcF family protein [Jatrophihabitans telluris]UQX88600.1 YdcF family protein [Jatrophihabitans telluris]
MSGYRAESELDPAAAAQTASTAEPVPAEPVPAEPAPAERASAKDAPHTPDVAHSPASSPGRRVVGPRKRSRRRWLRRTVAALFVLLLAWLTGCYVLLVRPHLDTPHRVDAILVLGPPDINDRYGRALELLEQGYSHNLVVSAVTEKQPQMQRACRNGIPDRRIICFYPWPPTTRGEAQKITELAAQYHWKSIMVVTSTFHISRARVIVRRCFPGQVSMVDTRRHIPLSQWAYEFSYQTGAWIKAGLNRDC